MQVSDIVAEELPVSLRESASAHSACLGGAISEAEYCEGLRGAGLESVEVPERLVYEDSQRMAMADELGVEVPQTTSCCGGDAVKALMAQVSGNVWSAQFRARKPE